MRCVTVRDGLECKFMIESGCSFKGGVCCKTIEQCKGCARSSEFSGSLYCTAYPEPALKWKNGNCNLATHVSSVQAKTETKINPLKASKRAAR